MPFDKKMGVCGSTIKYENTLKDVNDYQCIRINRFLNDLHEKYIKLRRSEEEVTCIVQAVEEMVAKLVEHVGTIDPRFEISHKYLVGSMAEETRIGEPDEYDFIVLMKHLSRPGVVEITRENCIGSTGYDVDLASIKILDENVADQYCSRVEDGFLSERIFNSCYNDAFASCLEKSIKHNKDVCINKEKGKLSIHSLKLQPHGPASIVRLLWRYYTGSNPPLKISVDVIPAIEIQGLTNTVTPDDVDIQKYYDKLLQDNKYMLIEAREIGKMNLSNRFQFTFTNTEVKLVKLLSPHHKKCYKILKYCLLDIVIGKKNIFSSYILKTFLLRHAAVCDHETNLFHCLRVLISGISDSYTCRIGLAMCMNAQSIFLCKNYIEKKRLMRDDLKTLQESLKCIVCQLIIIGKTGTDSVGSYSEESFTEFERCCGKFHPKKVQTSMTNYFESLSQCSSFDNSQ